MNLLVNATVLSNFAAIGRLDLLRDTIGPLYIPTEVYDEITAGQMAGYAFYDRFEENVAPLSEGGWLHLVCMTDEEWQLSTSMPAHLHRGECACLCIARNRGWGFLTDDRSARVQADLWSIPLSGTLGVLLLAVEDGRTSLDEGNTVLHQMVAAANYRSPSMDLRDFGT